MIRIRTVLVINFILFHIDLIRYMKKNLNEMLHSISLSLLVGFKVSNINTRKRSAYIKLILLSKYIEYYNANTKKQLEYHLKNPLEKDLTLEKGNKNV